MKLEYQSHYKNARVMRIDKPLQADGFPIWFGDTSEGVNLRWGYVNGDSRKIAKHALDDFTVHGFLAGATGQGKSVTVNALIYAMCAEYAPWELTLTLSDAKIVEFKTIALDHPMPQIDIVAATSDTEYLLSMLEKKRIEMDMRNSMFPKVGGLLKKEIKNIKQFREATGLCLPREVIIFDECTAMFQRAGKKANLIVKLLDEFARLGRSCGFHIFLDSQEVSADLPDKTLANLRLRGAMGCSQKISERVIGNNAAVLNLGKKGRLLVNTNADSEDSKAKNVLVRVPFFTDDQLSQVSDTVIQKANELGYKHSLQFYDESDAMYENKYMQFLNKYEAEKNEILLGPPSFIMDGEKEAVRIELTGNSEENVCIFVNGVRSKIRAALMLYYNFRRMPNQIHCFLMVDPVLSTSIDLSELKPIIQVDEKSYVKNTFFGVAKSTIYKRHLCIKADSIVFKSANSSKPKIDDLFYRVVEKGSEFDNTLDKMRFSLYVELLKSDAEFMSAFGISNSMSVEELEHVLRLGKLCLEQCHDAGCATTQVTKDKLTNAWFWVFGIDRVLGIGRDSKSAYLEDLKKMFYDGTAANVRFIIFTSSFDEITGLKEPIGFILADDLTQKQINTVKLADVYPENLSSNLMCLCGMTGNPTVQKFKKLYFDDEY